MHARNGLHGPAVAHSETVPVHGFHAADIGGAELRERDAVVAGEHAGHAGRPEQLVPQMPVHELVDVAKVLQQLPALVKRRRDQLDQRLGEVRGDVLVGERCAERRRVAALGDLSRRRYAQRFLFHAFAPAAQHAALPAIDEAGQPTLEFFVDHVTHHASARPVPARRLGYQPVHGSSATTSISTRKPGSTRRWTCTQDTVGRRSLS